MKVYLHLADGFEEIEAVSVADILRRAEIDVKLVSIMARKEVVGAGGININADMLFEEVDYSKGNMIVLPGGGLGTENLGNHKNLCEKIKEYYNEGKWVCAICAAPSIFGKLQILDGKSTTCYPGFEEDLKEAILKDERVVIDKNIITAKGPGVSFEFALKLVEVLRGDSVVNTLKEEMFII